MSCPIFDEKDVLGLLLMVVYLGFVCRVVSAVE